MDKIGYESLNLKLLVDKLDPNDKERNKTIAFISGTQKKAEIEFVHYVRHGWCLRCYLESLTVASCYSDYVSSSLDMMDNRNMGLSFHLKELWVITYIINRTQCSLDIVDLLVESLCRSDKENKFTKEQVFSSLKTMFDLLLRKNLEKVLDIYSATLYDIKAHKASLDFWLLDYWLNNALIFTDRYILKYEDTKRKGILEVWKTNSVDNTGFSSLTDPIIRKFTIGKKVVKKGNENEI